MAKFEFIANVQKLLRTLLCCEGGRNLSGWNNEFPWKMAENSGIKR